MYKETEDKNQSQENPEKATFEEFLEEQKYKNMFDSPEDFLENKSPTPVLWKEVNEKVYTEYPWRIKNLIPKQGFVILSSISGEKKTWVALEMARCISAGIDFLDEKDFETEGCNVLYLNCENPESELQRRGRQLNFADDSKSKLYLFNSGDINLNTPEGATWLLAVIEYYKIEVVFVDTFRAVAGSLKEEKAEEIREFFSRFAPLKNKGVAIVWLDHFRKPSNLDGKVPKKEHLLGSQDKTASVEVLLMMKSENGSEEINLYQRKNRLAIELKPFQILMKDQVEEEKRHTALSFGGVIEEQENKKEQAKEMIMAILESGGKTTKQIIEVTKKQVGQKNTRSALKDLVTEGLVIVTRRQRENYYVLPEEVEKMANETVPDDESRLFNE